MFSDFSSEDLTKSIAFFDPAGLLQIRFRHFDIADGRYNYAFDDVKTAPGRRPAPIPLPSGAALALTAIAALAAARGLRTRG